MDAIEFVANYKALLAVTASMLDSKYIPVYRELLATDPHDLIGPDHYFTSQQDAIGFITILLHNRIIKYNQNASK